MTTRDGPVAPAVGAALLDVPLSGGLWLAPSPVSARASPTRRLAARGEHTECAVIFGIDEAGRGPALGPLVMALVALDPAREATLVSLGVRDSKRFGAGRSAHAARWALAEAVVEHARAVAVAVIGPREIDDAVRVHGLDALERRHARVLLEAAAAPRDADVVCDGARLFAPLQREYPRLRALDRADDSAPSVSAASIVAKAVRDRCFSAIAARYADEFGPLAGGGYPNPPTKRFLAAFVDRYGCLPAEARARWACCQVLVAEGTPVAPFGVSPDTRPR